MSRVYCWQKYEDAKKNGLFEKFDNFWIYQKYLKEPITTTKYFILKNVEDVDLSIGTFIKPIEQEPKPDFLDLLGDGDDKPKY
jgi:hypothetical protein